MSLISTGDLPELTKPGLRGQKKGAMKMAKKDKFKTYSPEAVKQAQRVSKRTGLKPSKFVGSVADDSALRSGLNNPIPAKKFSLTAKAGPSKASDNIKSNQNELDRAVGDYTSKLQKAYSVGKGPSGSAAARRKK